MKEFMLIFRHIPNPAYQPSPEEMQEGLKHWQTWIGNIAGQGKFIGTNELSEEGKTFNKQGVISDGPYAEVKEIVGGYFLLKAESLDEAIELSQGCPILEYGGSVEVRTIVQRDYE